MASHFLRNQEKTQEKLLKQLCNKILDIPQEDENFQNAVSWAKQKLKNHRYADVQKKKVSEEILSIVDKFYNASQINKSKALQSCFEGYVSQIESTDTNYALLATLIRLADSPTHITDGKFKGITELLSPDKPKPVEHDHIEFDRHNIEWEIEFEDSTQYRSSDDNLSEWSDDETEQTFEDERAPDNGRSIEESQESHEKTNNVNESFDMNEEQQDDEMYDAYDSQDTVKASVLTENAYNKEDFEFARKLDAQLWECRGINNRLPFVSERFVVHHIVLMLKGLQGDVFRFSADDANQFEYIQLVRIPHMSATGLSQTIDFFLSAANKLQTVEATVVRSLSFSSELDTNACIQAFGCLVTKYLTQFRLVIDQFEHSSKVVSLLNLKHFTRPTFGQINFIYDVISTTGFRDVSSQCASAAKLLSTLYESFCAVHLSGSQEAPKVLTSLSMKLFLDTLSPYLDLVSDWIYRGRLSNYEEFMVKRAFDIAEFEAISWSRAFTLRRKGDLEGAGYFGELDVDMDDDDSDEQLMDPEDKRIDAPGFLKAIAHRILVTGKSLRIIDFVQKKKQIHSDVIQPKMSLSDHLRKQIVSVHKSMETTDVGDISSLFLELNTPRNGFGAEQELLELKENDEENRSQISSQSFDSDSTWNLEDHEEQDKSSEDSLEEFGDDEINLEALIEVTLPLAPDDTTSSALPIKQKPEDGTSRPTGTFTSLSLPERVPELEPLHKNDDPDLFMFTSLQAPGSFSDRKNKHRPEMDSVLPVPDGCFWPPSSIIEKCLINRISERHQEVHGQLFDLLINKCDLMKHLRTLRGFFLMDCGDVISRVTSTVFEQLENGVEMEVLQTRFADIISTGVQDSIYSEALFDNVIFADFSSDLRLNPTDDRNLSRQSYQMKALGSLRFSYLADYPLDIIISPTIMKKYNAIFSFLIQIKYAKHILEGISECTQISTNRGVTQMEHQYRLLKREHYFWINNFHYYIMARIKEYADKDCIDIHLSKAEDLDDMNKMHNNALDELMEKIVLTKVKKMIAEKIYSIMALALRLKYIYHEQILPHVENRHRLPPEAYSIAEYDICKQLSKLHKIFDEANNYILMFLGSLVKKQNDHHTHYSNSLMTLDFSCYYMKRYKCDEFYEFKRSRGFVNRSLMDSTLNTTNL